MKPEKLEFQKDFDAPTKTIVQNIRDYFNEYCNSSSIHGLKFLGERRRSILERLWWLITMCVSLYFGLSLILQAYQKWNLSPVVVSFATSETPVWNLPFPSVTICPHIKAPKHLINYTALVQSKMSNENLNNYQLNQLRYMNSICYNGARLVKNLQGPNYLENNEIVDFLMQVRPSVNTLIKEMYFAGHDLINNLHSVLVPVVTGEGICYSFNIMDFKDIFKSNVRLHDLKKYKIPTQPQSNWTLHRGFNKFKLDEFPRRTAIAGSHGGLSLTLLFNTSDMDYLCTETVNGFKIILNLPNQVPIAGNVYLQIGINQDVTIALKPNVMSTSGQLKHYSAEQRKCYFSRERKLKYFKVYDQQNCYFECLSDFTKHVCGCVAFFMLRDNSTLTCGPGKIDCVFRAQYLFLLQQVNPKNVDKWDKCDCLPSCSSLRFNSEITQCQWNWRERIKLLDPVEYHKTKNNGIEMTRIRIFYETQQFITSQRHELFGKMEFFASCGGLLGLFMGFSFISLVEIIYFLTLRFACNLRKNQKQKSENVNIQNNF